MSYCTAPLILSSPLPELVPAVIDIINNTEVIALNQDSLGVQARKLVANPTWPTALPFLVGLAPCGMVAKRSFIRGFQRMPESEDNLEWSVDPIR